MQLQLQLQRIQVSRASLINSWIRGLRSSQSSEAEGSRVGSQTRSERPIGMTVVNTEPKRH